MLVEKRRPKNAGEIPTSSMADIAFLLLVFFLVTTTINTDKGIPMLLPQWGDQLNVPRDNIVNVLINAGGEVMVSEELTPVPLITQNIKTRLEANDLLIVSIKPDKEVAYNTFIEVLDQVKLSGATRISIAELDQ